MWAVIVAIGKERIKFVIRLENKVCRLFQPRNVEQNVPLMLLYRAPPRLPPFARSTGRRGGE
jgi:hypothetical protein